MCLKLKKCRPSLSSALVICIIIVSSVINFASAQVPGPMECGTREPAVKPFITPEMEQTLLTARTLYTSPYPVKVFIVVFSDDDGTDLAATEADVLRQFENMRTAFAGHQVCFVITGYEVRANSDLNNMDIGETDDNTDLAAQVISNSFTLFIHKWLTDAGDPKNGTAYDIPNHYFSLVSAAINSTTNLSTMPHELGHCLGLLHTFSASYGEERVARSGSCKNCVLTGDLLCDTQADRDLPESSISASTCAYSGGMTDSCGDAYLMEEANIMTYGRRACRTEFTAGQQGRFLTYLLNTYSNRIAENDVTIAPNSFTSGRANYSARNTITFSTGTFTVSGSAMINFSSQEITLKPGIEFRPGTGYVHVNANAVYCQ